MWMLTRNWPRCVARIIALGVVIVFLQGCVESNFTLRAESPLPSWLSADISDSDAKSVKITLYTGDRVIFRVSKSDGTTVEKRGYFRWHPTSVKRGMGSYPLYLILSVDGKEDIYEQQLPEPYLRIVENVPN